MKRSAISFSARLSKHLAIATIAVAGTVASPSSADIIAWSDANLIVPNTLDGLYINVETRQTGSAGSVVAGWDINPYSANSLTWFNAAGTGMMRYPGVITGSAGNLPIGTTVGPTGSFGSGAVLVGPNPGEWQPNASNYFGFRFLASDGLTHYGWGRFVIGSSISGSDRFIAEIYFESVPGQPIEVGAGACTDPATYYVDADGDGFGAGPGLSSCVPIAGRVLNADDCDDSSPSVNPNSSESCNGIDDDCNGEVDEGTLNSFFPDADGDGFGASGSTAVPSCLSALPGFVLDSSDCNDAEAAVNPAAQEICDAANIDEDCDLLADDDDSDALEATKSNFYADTDGDFDGSGAPQRFCDLQLGYSATNTDHCPDFTGLFDPVRYFGDADGDGFGDPATWTDACTTTTPVGFAANSGDACPSDPAKSAPGVCGCGVADVDLNQNGVVDCVELTLSLVPSAGAVAAGGSFELGVVSGTPPVPMSGLQVILYFDPTLLSVTGIVATGAYETLLFSQYDNVAGTVRLAVGTLSDPVTSGGSVASIGFAVKPGASSDCDARERISFATIGGATTRFSRADGQAFVPQLETIAALSIDTAAPLVDSYAQTTELIARPDCAALAPDIAATVVATDDCSAAGALIVAQSPPAGSSLTLGSHPVSLTITDEAGNSRVATATVVVNGTSVDYYIDADGDGFGAAGSVPQSSCAPVPGWVDDSSDCNDGLVLYGDQDGDGFGSDTVVPCAGVSNSDDCDDDQLQYADNDADGFGAGGPVACGVSNNTDCNDGDASINPSGIETCDGVDEDCNGSIDDGLAYQNYYPDSDSDTFGSSSASAQSSCAPVDGKVTNNLDCNDGSPSINPNGVETCDGIDQDCDGSIDDGLTFENYYPDSDGDGFGSSSATAQSSCAPVSGKVTNNTDCNDMVASINPNGVENCDGVDQDCDGTADDGLAFVDYYPDADNDTYGDKSAAPQSSCTQVPGKVTNNLDCNDGNALVNPSGIESCNGADDDCDSQIDDGLTFLNYYTDGDSDGFGSSAATAESSCAPVAGKVTNNTDCDDTNASIKPGAPEACDGVDQDCDGLIDEELVFQNYYTDADNDGYGDKNATAESSCAPVAGKVLNNTDCNDTNAAVNPGAQEVCDAANTDEDCDGFADNDDSSAADAGKSDFYVDADGDGSGSGAPSRFCDQPAGYSANANDTCPQDAALLDPIRYYFDGDADNYGNSEQPFDACSTTPPIGYVAMGGDCNDANAAINPGAQEVCDAGNVDEDCDGLADDADPSALGKQVWYLDADNDGYHSGGAVFLSCEPQVPQPLPGDCNDSNPSVNPGAAEACGNGIDDDCDGQADEGCGVFALYLTPSAASIAPGDTFTVRASCTAPSAAMSGVQIAVHFDASRLRLDGVNPVGTSPMALEIAEQANNSAGTLRYAMGLADPAVPLASAADLCDIVFTVLPGADTCGAADLAFFADVGPFTTRFTDAATASAVVPVLVGLPTVNLDTTAPALSGVPETGIEVYADAGMAGAHVVLPIVSASDGCDGAVAVTVDGAPAGGFFPIGTTVVTWSATDAAGNTTSASRTVTVLALQLLDVTVTLEGAGIAPMSRTIRVGAGGLVAVRTVSLSEEIRSASGAYVIAVRGTASGIAVPAGASLGCVSVKDPVHSVTAVSPASLSGARWSASVTLLQGDSNGDDMVEIVDYGLWVTDRNAAAGGAVARDARSNFNGDLAVNNSDYGYVALNFFRVGESCTPGAQGPTPRDRITVKELRRRGLGELVAADLNHDGWLDLRDIQVCMQGGSGVLPRPEAAVSDGVSW